jgi:catechol 2,3-dioxygenase-like lactoylglutathione lyase family enzyme
VFEVIRMFHPSFHILDLDEAERWYERVFGLSSTRLSTGPVDPDNRTDYSTFTLIRDVLMDSIDPTRFVKNGVQQYPTIDEPHLKGFGWCVEDLIGLYRDLRSKGIRLVGNLGEEGTDDEPPTAHGSSMPMFFTVPAQTGLRYQFIAPFPMQFDPRTEPGWTLGPVRADDPLTIEFTSHHTIVTDQPARALHLFVDLLGGRVIHEGRDEVRSTSSTYVRLADAAFEFAVPDEGTPAFDDWKTTAPNDSYHAITFKVADLDKVRDHLRAVDVGLRSDTASFLVTDPKTSLGVPWGFSSTTIPGDERT